MATTRIKDDAELNSIVDSIKEVIPSDKMSEFLDARLTAYNRETKSDAYITLKEGRKYLPYPFNVRLVARLHDDTASEVTDAFDI